jgi:carbonic anhydrase/acetyltransferase-like protein (isoleucine patch superfamily)
MLANVGPGPEVAVTVVLDETSRSAQPVLGARWKKSCVRVHFLEGGCAELARLMSASSAGTIVVAALTSVCVVDSANLLDRAASAGSHLVKFSVGRTPVEVFAAEKQRVVRILEGAASRSTGAPRPRRALFDDSLHTAIDLLEDLPGELLFQNDLMDYYLNNMWLLANSTSERYHRTVARLPALNDRGVESRIGERGSVNGSWIASGVEVEGTVEEAVLFPNVVVRRNAVVSRSLVLSGNRIGAGTEIHGAMILPYTTEAPRPSPNIGDNCLLGVRSSTMTNADFPEHIRDGLAVVGMNAEIPNGFKAEGGSYIAPGTPAAALRKLKLLRRGTSVFPGAPAPAAGGADATEATG